MRLLVLLRMSAVAMLLSRSAGAALTSYDGTGEGFWERYAVVVGEIREVAGNPEKPVLTVRVKKTLAADFRVEPTIRITCNLHILTSAYKFKPQRDTTAVMCVLRKRDGTWMLASSFLTFFDEGVPAFRIRDENDPKLHGFIKRLSRVRAEYSKKWPGVIPLAITTDSMPQGIVDVHYSQPLAFTGGKPPLSWSIAEGKPPPRIGIHGGTGVIRGIPRKAGTYEFTVKVQDASYFTVTVTKRITIKIVGPPAMTTTPLPVGGPDAMSNIRLSPAEPEHVTRGSSSPGGQAETVSNRTYCYIALAVGAAILLGVGIWALVLRGRR